MTARRVVDLLSYRGMGKQLPIPPAWQQPLDDFVGWLRAAGRPESTIYLRQYQLVRFATTTGLEPYDATLDVLIEYLASHGWSANTRRATRSGLRGFYRWAHATGRMPANPAELLPVVAAPLGRPRPAAEDDVTAGLRAADDRVRLMVKLAATAGLRCCEIACVASSDVRRDLVGYSLVVHGKGNKTRVVPIADVLAARILDAGGWLFPGQVDGHLSAAYVSKLVSRVLPDGVTAHMLRHRFASRAYSADADIRAVQELLGHASVATTQVYTQVPDDHLRRAMLAAA